MAIEWQCGWNKIEKKGKAKGSFYIAQYPLARSKRFTLFALPDRPVHSDTNSDSQGSILDRQQLRAKTKSLTFPPLSIARYSFIHLSQQGRQWRERKCPIFETVAKGDSNPGSLDCESGVLPLSYHAPRIVFARNCCVTRMLPREAELVSEWTGLPMPGGKV